MRIHKMTQNSVTLEIFQEIFKEWGQTLVATTSEKSMMSAFMERPYPKEIPEVLQKYLNQKY